MGTLTEYFVDGAKWPLPFVDKMRSLELERFQQLFDNDRATMLDWVQILKQVGGSDDEDDPYRVILDEFTPYPSPEIAARTLASFLFGEPAQITSDAVQDEIDALVEDNHLHALNQEAAVSCAVEGEVYYKLDWDADISNTAIISAVSACKVFPVFKFRRLSECAFVSVLPPLPSQTSTKVVWRHVEIREKGAIFHLLFKGEDKKLGKSVDLDSHPDTMDLEAVIETEIDDLLVRHVPLWRTTRSPHGISIFQGKEGLIEGIHSLYTQDQHDAEMTKRRIAAAEGYLKKDHKNRPKFDRQMDLFILDEQAMGAMGSESKPIHQIEFTDSTVMGQRISQRLDEFLLACGIAPESAGRGSPGSAQSGTARKLAQSLTIQTIGTSSRYFTPAIRDVVELALRVGEKKLGRTLGTDVEKLRSTISCVLQDGLSEDIVEQSTVIASLRGAQAMSIEEAVRRVHPEWDDKKVQAEVDRIHDDQGLTIPPPLDTLPNDALGVGNEDDPSAIGAGGVAAVEGSE